jgi:hypothetical protein
LNYVYAIVEAETRIASIALGLDPAIGIMHSDLRARDSLACDLMEAIRPQADQFVLELIRNREFRQNDFFETREGICWVLPPLNHEIAQSAPKWRRLIGPIAEEIAQTLFKSASKYLNRTLSNNTQQIILPIAKNILPTPLTGSNRSLGREFEIPTIQIEDTRERKKRAKIMEARLHQVWETD